MPDPGLNPEIMYEKAIPVSEIIEFLGDMDSRVIAILESFECGLNGYDELIEKLNWYVIYRQIHSTFRKVCEDSDGSHDNIMGGLLAMGEVEVKLTRRLLKKLKNMAIACRTLTTLLEKAEQAKEKQ